MKGRVENTKLSIREVVKQKRGCLENATSFLQLSLVYLFRNYKTDSYVSLTGG